MKDRKSIVRKKLALQQGIKTTLRQRGLLASLFLLMAGGLVLFFNFSNNTKTLGAVSGDFRSKAAGNWNSTSTWEKFNGLTWGPTLTTPTSADGTITIQSGFNVTVTANVTADQVVVNSGAQLNVTTGSLTIANGTGTDLDVNGAISITNTLLLNSNSAFNLSGTGIINAAGTLTISSGAALTVLNGATLNHNGGTLTTTGTFAVNNGATYVHNANGKNIPTATWGASSTIRITGVTSSDVSGLGQNFGNFVYNCPSQNTAGLQFWDQLGSIQGDFTIQSTGTGTLFLQRISTTSIVSVGGNYLQTGGTVYMTKGAAYNMTVSGNFTVTGGTFIETEKYGVPILNVYGTFLINGGTFNHSTYNSNIAGEGIGTVNLYGDYLISSGSHTETATLTGRGDFNFTKTGTQTFAITGGSITNTVNFTVNTGAILDMSTYAITSAGTFTLMSGGGLILASPNGITASSMSGNVQVTGTRSFSTGGDYTFNASSAQVTGNGLPATVHNLTFDNTSGVTLSGSSSATNILALTNGIVTTTAAFELGISNPETASITGYSSANYVIGNLRRAIYTTGTYDYPLGTAAYYEPGTLAFTGQSGISNMLGTFTNANPITPSYPLVNVYCNGSYLTDMLDYGYWTFTPNSAMTGGNYTVTLTEKGASNVDPNPLTYCVLKRVDVNAPWKSIGTHNNNTQSVSGNSVTAARSALTAFSDFGIGKSSWGSLPIKLILFQATLNNGIVRLEWSTAAEVNNNFFTVERSDDGIHFDALLKKPGAGNSTEILRYSAADNEPLNGYSYYRLRQTDFDGHSTCSDSRTIKNGEGSEGGSLVEIKSIAPNPFSQDFNVFFSAGNDGAVSFSLMNSSGKMVESGNMQVQRGMNRFEFTDRYNLSKGIYFLVLNCGNQKLIQKMIKE